MIKDNGYGFTSGTFLKLGQRRRLQQGQLLLAGDQIFVVGFLFEQALVDKENEDKNFLIKLPYTTPDTNQTKPISKLVIKFLKGAKEGIKLQFATNDMPLYMGRDKKAGICFQQDMLLSRLQMRFDFADDNWLISDGDGE